MDSDFDKMQPRGSSLTALESLIKSFNCAIKELENYFPIQNNLKQMNFVINLEELEKEGGEESITKGDISTSIAMLLASKSSSSIDIANKVAELFKRSEFAAKSIKEIKIAGPGFININLDDTFVLKDILRVIKDSDCSSMKNSSRKINLEFASANPTGPIHIGHIRGAILGETIFNMLVKTGAHVTKEYYINDAGSQIENLLDSVLLRCEQDLNIDIVKNKNSQYPGEYISEIAEKVMVEFGRDFFISNFNDNKRSKIQDYVISYIIDNIKSDLKKIHVTHSSYISEKEISKTNLLDRAMEILKNKDLVYIGRISPPKGARYESWEVRDQLLFRSTKFGDDIDRPLKKGDGSWSYFALDIAYHLYKIERGFTDIIVVLGKDHGSYAKRIAGAVSALSDNQVKFIPIMYDIVNVKSGEKIIKMSKRSGTFITLADLLEKIDQSLVKIVMLTRSNNKVLDFDLKKVTEQSKDNPAFYIQYAHARLCSIIKNCGMSEEEITIGLEAHIKQFRLANKKERLLCLLVIFWEKYLLDYTESLEPYKIVFYLLLLSKTFHAFWTLGKTNHSLRFINNPDKIQEFKMLSIALAVRKVIASGLGMINVKPKSRM